MTQHETPAAQPHEADCLTFEGGPCNCRGPAPATQPSYFVDLKADLQNDEYALKYIAACAKDSTEALRVGLRDLFAARSPAPATTSSEEVRKLARELLKHRRTGTSVMACCDCGWTSEVFTGENIFTAKEEMAEQHYVEHVAQLLTAALQASRRKALVTSEMIEKASSKANAAAMIGGPYEERCKAWNKTFADALNDLLLAEQGD